MTYDTSLRTTINKDKLQCVLMDKRNLLVKLSRHEQTIIVLCLKWTTIIRIQLTIRRHQKMVVPLTLMVVLIKLHKWTPFNPHPFRKCRLIKKKNQKKSILPSSSNPIAFLKVKVFFLQIMSMMS
jgi:hypothetical protein